MGQTIDLSRVRLPIYLLVGSDDDVVAPEQLLALERLAGMRPEGCEVASCDHLSLFMGKEILEECWPRIARWMQEPFLERNRARL